MRLFVASAKSVSSMLNRCSFSYKLRGGECTITWQFSFCLIVAGVGVGVGILCLASIEVQTAC